MVIISLLHFVMMHVFSPVFNSRKTHVYQTISQSADETEAQNGEVEAEDEEEADENASVTTQLTTLTYSDGSAAQVGN